MRGAACLPCGCPGAGAVPHPWWGAYRGLLGGLHCAHPWFLRFRNQQGEPSSSEAWAWERMLGGSLSFHQGGWFKVRMEENAQLNADAPTSSLGP